MRIIIFALLISFDVWLIELGLISYLAKQFSSFSPQRVQDAIYA